MPAVVSHYLLARRVLARLEKSGGNVIPCPDAFILGASGPDVFFGHRVMPWQKGKSLSKISNIMHEYGGAAMLNLLFAYGEASGGDAAYSYALGFCTHFAFDSIAHPYIVGRCESEAGDKRIPIGVFSKAHPKVSEGLSLASVLHNRIEAELDSVFLMKDMHIPIRKFSFRTTCPNDRETVSSCADALREYLMAAGLVDDPDHEEVMRAFTDWRRALVLLDDRLLLKKAFLEKMEKLLDLPPTLSIFYRSCKIDIPRDCANFSHTEWTSSFDGSKHSESFFELVSKAEDYSLRLINKLISGELLTPSDCPANMSGHPKKKQTVRKERPAEPKAPEAAINWETDPGIRTVPESMRGHLPRSRKDLHAARLPKYLPKKRRLYKLRVQDK